MLSITEPTIATYNGITYQVDAIDRNGHTAVLVPFEESDQDELLVLLNAPDHTWARREDGSFAHVNTPTDGAADWHCHHSDVEWGVSQSYPLG